MAAYLCFYRGSQKARLRGSGNFHCAQAAKQLNHIWIGLERSLDKGFKNISMQFKHKSLDTFPMEKNGKRIAEAYLSLSISRFSKNLLM